MIPNAAILGLACCACVLHGCSGTPSAPALATREQSGAMAPFDTEALPAPFAGALTGIELGAGRDDWQIGDRVLLGIRATKPDTSFTRYLLIELLPETIPGKPLRFDASTGDRPFLFTSPVGQTKLTVFDDKGQVVESAVGRFPIGLLGYGPIDGVEPMLERPELRNDKAFAKTLSDEQFDRTMRGWLTLFAFSGSMNKRGMFNAMMKDMVARPSWLAMLLNPSAEMTFGENQWPAAAPDWTTSSASLRTVTIPLQLRIAGKPALRGEMLATEPLPPLSLCGGLIRAHAVRPDDSSYRMDLWLIACARGTGGRSFTPASAAPPAPGSHQTP